VLVSAFSAAVFGLQRNWLNDRLDSLAAPNILGTDDSFAGDSALF